jgi:flagellar basal body-associated protein FliL
MDLGAYFIIIQYVLMAATFVALVLIFLYTFYGKEEEQATEKT